MAKWNFNIVFLVIFVPEWLTKPKHKQSNNFYDTTIYACRTY